MGCYRMVAELFLGKVMARYVNGNLIELLLSELGDYNLL